MARHNMDNTVNGGFGVSGKRLNSSQRSPSVHRALAGSLFGFPRVKLTFEKKDSLEQLLTRTPKPKRLPALRVRTVVCRHRTHPLGKVA